jgi:hypothetical protein
LEESRWIAQWQDFRDFQLRQCADFLMRSSCRRLSLSDGGTGFERCEGIAKGEDGFTPQTIGSNGPFFRAKPQGDKRGAMLSKSAGRRFCCRRAPTKGGTKKAAPDELQNGRAITPCNELSSEL